MQAWDSGSMSEEGETFDQTFETEWVYHYICRPHEGFGMVATVIVVGPHLDDHPTLTQIPEDKPEEVRGKLAELKSLVQETVGGGHADEEHDSTT